MPTGQPAAAMPLTMSEPTVVTPDIYGISVSGPSLHERQLYDVAVLAEGNQWRVIAPHAVYHRRTWTDFGIAHNTDVHVARRIDTFRGLLSTITHERFWQDRDTARNAQ